MPKTTARHGGGNILEPDYFEREAEKWPGKPSEKSSAKPARKPSKKTSGPSPARTMGHPSKRDPVGSSTAGSTAGSGKDLPDTPSDKLPPRKDAGK